MASTTIRVAASTPDAVNRIRELTGDSTASVIGKALVAYEESVFWKRWRCRGGIRAARDRGRQPADVRILFDL